MSDGASILLAIGTTTVGYYITRWYYRRSGSDLGAAGETLRDAWHRDSGLVMID